MPPAINGAAGMLRSSSGENRDVALHPLNLISLCSGGGGLDLGVELAIPCARPVVLVEREAFACARLVAAMRQGLLADAPVWSDVRTFDGRRWRGLVDGVIGGIPCQPHSLAGLRKGKDDERDLWSAARRIIVQSGCWFVLIENVEGMLSSGGAERVWRDLQRLGFAVEIGLFSAEEIGAPHQRNRTFVLAVADRDHQYGNGPRIGGPGRRIEFTDGRNGVADACGAGLALGFQPADGRGTIRDEGASAGADCGAMDDPARCDGSLYARLGRRGQSEADAGGAGDLGIFPPGPGDLGAWRNVLARAPQFEPAVRRMADGLASRVDRLRMLGNGVVPLEAAYALRTLCARLAARGCAGAGELVSMMAATPAETVIPVPAQPPRCPIEPATSPPPLPPHDAGGLKPASSSAPGLVASPGAESFSERGHG